MSRWARIAAAALAVCLAVAGPALSEDALPDDTGTYVQDDAVAAELEPGVVDAFDEPDAAADAAAEAAATGGAVLKAVDCTLQGHPFRQTVRISGRLVSTPSGTVTLVCHGRVTQKVLRVPIDQAVVVNGGACTIPPRRTTNDSQLVVTPSLHVTLVCHVHPSA
jgi:hypothetical protein